jgi:K+-transporting ATPase ATPase A chain
MIAPLALTLPSLGGWLQLVLAVALLLLAAEPLGRTMARVYEGRPCVLNRWFGGLERLLERLAGVPLGADGQPAPDADMTWRRYGASVLAFTAMGFLAVYALQRLQGLLPLNPQGFSGVEAGSAFNTAVSFVTNTNWQGYGGETTMSALTQAAALGVQNFLSAATGMAVLAALARGIARREARGIGNFWVDLVRSTLYVLLPLSLVLAVVLLSQGVVQSVKPYQEVSVLVPLATGSGDTVTTQTVPLGLAASQVAIKQLGTNGGGYFNANSAHPLENPTNFSNLLQCLSILLIPAGLCITFGTMVGDRRQGRAILAAMTVLFAMALVCVTLAEQSGNPRLSALGVAVAPTAGPGGDQAGGSMEGKEARFGVVQSSLWAVATTSASNGSVNAMHDSMTPLGGGIAMWLMQLGEVVFGGVGSGLYGMIVFVIVAVFVAGLMVGRTPEYLGKKIEPFEMKMASLAILIPCAAVLVGTAIATVAPGGATTSNPGPHGFSQALYALSSASNNNGSAFAGLSANTPFWNGLLAVCMVLGRFGVLIPVLAIAGSLAAKRSVPVSSGTLPTHTPLFVLLLIAVVVVVGALTFLPALALGPIAEQLSLAP